MPSNSFKPTPLRGAAKIQALGRRDMNPVLSRQQRRAAIASAQKHALSEQRKRDIAARKLAQHAEQATDEKYPSAFEVFSRVFGGPLVRLYYACKRL